jgi:uncharacterized peroxidase-related enzyme
MTWISAPAVEDAIGKTKQVYERILRDRGNVANIFLAQGLDPVALEDHMSMYMHLMIDPGPLSREEREMVAVVVSAANRCAYDAVHHSEALEAIEKDPAALKNLLKEFSTKHESPRSKALLAYAAKLTLDPKDITQDDIKDLRDVGLTDVEILRANLIASYFSFSNRIALGLGIEIETGTARAYKY